MLSHSHASAPRAITVLPPTHMATNEMLSFQQIEIPQEDAHVLIAFVQCMIIH